MQFTPSNIHLTATDISNIESMITELKPYWQNYVDLCKTDPSLTTPGDRDRSSYLPNIINTINTFTNNTNFNVTNISAFNSTIYSHCKKEWGYWGPQSAGGRINYLIGVCKNNATLANKLGLLLKNCINPPADFLSAGNLITTFINQTDTLLHNSKGNASTIKRAALYVLSFFWQCQDSSIPEFYSSINNTYDHFSIWPSSNSSISEDKKFEFFCLSYEYIKNNIEKLTKINLGRPISYWDLEHVFYNSDPKKNNTIQPQQSAQTTSIVSQTTVFPLNTILYGPAGTSKTYSTRERAVEICNNISYADKSPKEIKDAYNKLIEHSSDSSTPQIVFTTFHQSLSYEDFIEGIKPDLQNDGQTKDETIKYKIQDGIFKELALRAKNNSDKNYLLIIDEINRGNVAQIFGELITLIEESKREGNDDAMSAILPYSHESFSIPRNLYILGTMNTADRSVEPLDAALRRRFTFEEMMPKPDLLIQEVKDENGADTGIELNNLLATINNRLEYLLDRDHTIGHAYFMDVTSLQDLQDTFAKKVIPQLQEYFYADWGKINLILGDKFITNNTTISANDLFKNSSLAEYDIDADKKIWMKTEPTNWTAQDFIDIYS